MEMDNKSRSAQYKENPLDQVLILELVLKYVGKTDTNDLLACRLVNHSWNRAAVSKLEEHGYAVQLDNKKMVKFGSLLLQSRTSRAEQSQSGFSGLSFTDLTDHHLLARSLILSLAMKVVLDDDCAFAYEMDEAVQFLKLYPQLRVALISCTYDSSFRNSNTLLRNHELFNVLSLTSSTLTSIKILVNVCATMYDHISSSSEEFDFNESFGRLEFPKLTSLRYRYAGYNRNPDNDLLDTTRQVLSVIKKSPNLTKLDLDIWEGSADKSANCVQQLIEPCSTNLEQLTVRFGDCSYDFVLNTLSEIKFPKLSRLKLSSFRICENTQWFTQHLTTNCPAITRFQIINVWVPDEPEELEKLQLEFPIFNNITHFGFYTSFLMSVLDPEHLECGHATFNKIMSSYPGVIVMRLDLGALLTLGAHLKLAGQVIPQRDQYPVFHTISTLKIKISNPWDILDFMESATQIYHHTFPAIRKLIIKLPKMSFGQCDEEELLAQAIAVLCCHPAIREIEMHNYAFPWFEEMAEAKKVNLANWEGVSGVKSLKVFPPKCSDFDEWPELHLRTILTEFPNLEFLQYEKEMISFK